MTENQKIAIESHYQAQTPRYFVPFDEATFIGEKYDETGFVGQIVQKELVYTPGRWTPDSHVVCDFVLK